MMDTIYSLMDAVLPFAWLGSNFMKNAFLAVLLVTPLFGLISTMVVSNRMAFFSDSPGHGAFTGIAIGVLLGSVSPLLSLVVFSVVFALFITYIKNKSTASTDTIIGVFSATAIALGLMIMSHGGGFNKFSSFLIGDILSITPDDLSALAVVFVLGLVAWGLLFNQLLVLSINSSFARSRGIPAFWIESACTRCSPSSSPSASSGSRHPDHQRDARSAGRRALVSASNVKQYHISSPVLIAMFSGFLGLMLALKRRMAAGATIVVISSVLFFLIAPVEAVLQPLSGSYRWVGQTGEQVCGRMIIGNVHAIQEGAFRIGENDVMRHCGRHGLSGQVHIHRTGSKAHFGDNVSRSSITMITTGHMTRFRLSSASTSTTTIRTLSRRTCSSRISRRCARERASSVPSTTSRATRALRRRRSSSRARSSSSRAS